MRTHNDNTKKNTSLIYLIFFAALTLASCSSNSEKTPQETETQAANGVDFTVTQKQFQSSDMKLGKLEPREFNKTVEAKGMIDVPPEYRASVSSYFGGTVKSIKLLPGEHVKRGQTLFVLENPEYVQMQQDYLEAKGQLSYLQADYERQKNLVQDNVTSQKKYLKSESDFTVTKVKLESIGKKLKLMNINPGTLTMENMQSTINITSPISGYVTEINITKGTFLDPSQTAITIVNTDHLHLELDIFERDLTKVSVGQSIRFSIQSDPDSSYEASVYLVNRNVDPEKRTIGIHGHLSDASLSSRLNPGMYVEAEIFSRSESKPSLPEEALVDIENKHYALALQKKSDGNYKFVKHEMKVGASDNGFIEIRNYQEFNSDTEFLVKGAFNLIKE